MALGLITPGSSPVKNGDAAGSGQGIPFYATARQAPRLEKAGPHLDNCPNCPYTPHMPGTDLTTAEAAQKLQVSERTIRRMIIRGSISAHKLDPASKSVYRIPQTEIDRILGERKKSKISSS